MLTILYLRVNHLPSYEVCTIYLANLAKIWNLMYPYHYLVLKRHLSTSFGTKFDNLLQPESQNILNQWLVTFYDYRRTGRALIWYQSDAMGCKPSSIYSCSIDHILEHKFCRLGCWAVGSK